ncbi:MAG: DNA polymerase/3'-5' exonuclease PolX [Candidatus Rifleibacteriota bacterium]
MKKQKIRGQKMKNREIASKLREIADIMEMQEIKWKPRAYRNAANKIETMDKNISKIYEREGKKGLEDIPTIGKNLAEHISDFIDKGSVKEWEELGKETSKELINLNKIKGLGPSKVKKLSKELEIENLDDLKKAIKEKKLREVEGFGRKTEENLIQSIKQFEKSHERIGLGKAWKIAHEIIDYLKQNNDIEKIDYVGSLRRMKETIGDVDILVFAKKPGEVMNSFIKMKNVSRILVKGKTKSSVVLDEGIDADLRVVAKDSYGAALQYFTGSKSHNIELRKLALKKGCKLSEYGLFNKKTDEKIAGANEEDIYESLGLQWIPPELRENKGEIEQAKEDKLPELIELKAVKGDLHMHTKYSDGFDSIKNMAKKARERKYEYIAITDHSKTERIAKGLKERQIKQQWQEIERIQNSESIKILKGAEVDILPDGNLDYNEEILRELDIVLVSVHSRFNSSKKEMTERILKALDNEHVNILAHPTGRMINKRQGYNADFDKIFKKCKQKNIAVEINCHPARLDLNDKFIRAAKKHNIKFSFGTDAHSTGSLDNLRFGVGTARRAGLEKKDLINTLSYKKLKNFLKK